MQAGLWNVVSVPDGAPATVRDEVDPSQDRKFSYFHSCKDMLQNPDFSAEVTSPTVYACDPALVSTFLVVLRLYALFCSLCER